MERGFDPAREYLKAQHLEAEYECRTATESNQTRYGKLQRIREI